MRFMDIVRWHDGTEGPEGCPAEAVQHDGTRMLREDEVRMTLEEWNATVPTWTERAQAWEAKQPKPEPPSSPKTITSLEFLKRLPTARLAQIIKAARELSVQGEPMPDTFLTLICAAQEIDLNDSEVLNGLEIFRHMGLITSEEKDILLGKKEPPPSFQMEGLALRGEIK